MRCQYRIAVLLLPLAIGAAGCRVGRSAQDLVTRGDSYASQQKYDEAILDYRNALNLDPKLGVAHAHLAEAYLKTDAGNSALKELLRAAELLPDDVEAQLKAGRLLLLAGRFEEARTFAEKALAKNSASIDALVLKANATVGLKDIDTAIKDVNDAISIDPKDARSYAAIGAMQLTKGRQAEAEASFKQAVQTQPASVIAQLALGHYYWAVGRLPEAEAPLKRAVELAPENPVAQRALITFYIATGRPNDAEAPLKAMADTLKTVDARLALADLHIHSARLDEATKVLTTVAAEPAGFAPATTRLAAIDYAQGRDAQAKTEIDAVLAKRPTYAEALVLKARFLMADGHIDDALARAKAATEADPRLAEAHYVLGTLYVKLNDIDAAIGAFAEVLKLNPMISGAQLQLVQLYLQKGDSQTAVNVAEHAVEATPGDRMGRVILARALAGHGDIARAESVMKTLLAEAPDTAAFHSAMGELQILKKDRAAARREFARALALDANSIDALRGQVGIDIVDHNVAHARALLDARLQASPANPALLLLAAQTYAAAGDEPRQEAALRKLIDADPANAQAFGALASLFLRQGKLADARAEYQAISARQPTSITAPTMVGMILEAEHKTDEAQKTYEQVIAAHPQAGLAANNLAWLYAESGANLDVALQLAQTAKQQLSNMPEVDDTLGWIYYKKNLATLAVPPFEAAVHAAPKNATFAYHLGLAYAKARDKAKAMAAFNQALKQRSDFPEATQARDALGGR